MKLYLNWSNLRICILSVLTEHYHDWIKALYGTKWPLEEAPTPQAITKSIERLGARFSRVKKQHNGSMKDVTISPNFLSRNTRLGYFKGRVLQFSPVRKPASLKDNHKPPGQCKDEYVQKCRELKQKLHAVTRNTTKRLKHRDAIIQQQKSQIHTQQQDMKRNSKG